MEARGKHSAAAVCWEGAAQKPPEAGWAEEQLTSPCSLVKFLHVLVNVKQLASSGFGAILVMSSFLLNFPLLELWDDV